MDDRAHRYAGKAQQRRLKNKITNDESRRLSPYIAGPNVPWENLHEPSELIR